MSDAFVRIARLQLDRLRRYASELSRGEANPGSARQAAERLRRFVLSAQEGSYSEVKTLLEEVEARFDELAAGGAEGAAWLAERIDAVAAAVGRLPAASAPPPRRHAILAPEPAPAAAPPDDPGFERNLAELDLAAVEAEAAGAAGVAARIRAAALRLREGRPGRALVPLAALLERAFDLGRQAAAEIGREADWVATGRTTAIERELASWLEGHLGHLVSNAVRHGLESPGEREAAGKPRRARVWIAVEVGAGGLAIDVADDGRGMQDAPEAALEGRGGLASLAAETREHGGSVVARTEAGRGTQVGVRVPIGRARLDCVVVEAGGAFALAADRVRAIDSAPPDPHATRPADLGSLLWGAPGSGRTRLALETARGTVEISVDRLGSQRPLVLVPVDLPGPSPVAATFRDEGRVGYFLDPERLADRIEAAAGGI